jgi:hypothetical protein
MRLGLGLGFSAKGGNAAPTDIALSDATVAENAELGTVIGALTGTDPEGSALTFTLTDDANGYFDIDGTDLILSGVLDFETAASHNVTVRATDSGGAFFDEVFAITVTDVEESFSSDDDELPDDGDVEDDGTFDNPPVVTVVDGAIKLQGKKATGSTGKFIYNIGPPIASFKYTMTYDPDFSLLAQQGKLAMVGFGFKQGNDFRISGLKGDGSTGLDAYEISGDELWNATAGFTEVDGDAAQHGTQAGPNWLQLEVSADGATYTLRTSSDGLIWVDEFTDVVPSPFAEATDAGQFGIAAFFDGTDAGSFSIAITLWTAGLAASSITIAKNAGDSGSTDFNFINLTFDSENVDTSGCHSTLSATGRLTIPASLSGRYAIIHAFIQLNSVTANSGIAGSILKNGALYVGSGMEEGHLGNHTTAYLSIQTAPTLLVVDDFYEVQLDCVDTATILEGDVSAFSLYMVG